MSKAEIEFKRLLNLFFGPRHSSLRIGQHCFNVLWKEHREIAEEVKGSLVADPFYQDYKLPEFLIFIKDNLEMKYEKE